MPSHDIMHNRGVELVASLSVKPATLLSFLRNLCLRKQIAGIYPISVIASRSLCNLSFVWRGYRKSLLIVDETIDIDPHLIIL